MRGFRLTWVVLGLLALTPAAARGDDTQVTVSAGSTHTCALLAPSGHVECWGEGAQGQLGDGTSTASPVPVMVSGLAAAKDVSAGTDHACAVAADGGVRCWGFATDLYLGAGQVVPAPVRGAAGALTVSAGAEHDCTLQAGGGVQCWGAGTRGELGDGAKANRPSAVAVSGVTTAVAISAGPGHTCAVLADGSLRCWGRGSDGELGNGANADAATPVTVNGIATAVAVSSGANHACAVLAGGGVACWGSNRYGQLGDGGSADSATPVAVSGVTDAVSISAGGTHSCALLASRSAVCWGRGGDGELGDGLAHDSATPVAVGGLNGALELSAGLGHTCAAVPGPAVACWGAGGHGQLGDGRKASSARPVRALLALTPPQLGSTTTLQRVSGTVRVKPPGSARFVALGATSTLPVGTRVDATRGKLRLTSAVDAQGRTQSGLFYQGEFAIGQQPTGLTVLTLTRVSGCAKASAAAKPKKKRKRKRSNSLWGDGEADFQTAGRYGSATVRGTRWLVADTCAGTTVRVARGRVRVKNLVTHKTTLLSALHAIVITASGRSHSIAHRSTRRGFATSVERLLTRLASGRKRLAAALGGALRCSLSSQAAGRRVGDVIANRTSLRAAAAALGAPTARARTVRARLRTAITRSLAADRHYRDWLSGVAGASCPLPHTGAFAAAGREDVKATRAKRRLVAAFNPLARREHLRTWRAGRL